MYETDAAFTLCRRNDFPTGKIHTKTSPCQKTCRNFDLQYMVRAKTHLFCSNLLFSTLRRAHEHNKVGGIVYQLGNGIFRHHLNEACSIQSQLTKTKKKMFTFHLPSMSWWLILVTDPGFNNSFNSNFTNFTKLVKTPH